MIDNIPVHVLRDSARQIEVHIAPSLGLNSYSMTVKGKPVFWSPYKSLGEFAAKPTFLGNPLLWPWANRIDGLITPSAAANSPQSRSWQRPPRAQQHPHPRTPPVRKALADRPQ